MCPLLIYTAIFNSNYSSISNNNPSCRVSFATKFDGNTHLEWSFVEPSSSTSHTAPAAETDPFSDFNQPATTQAQPFNDFEDDPLAMFGGSPAPSQQQQQHSIDKTNEEDLSHTFEDININEDIATTTISNDANKAYDTKSNAFHFSSATHYDTSKDKQSVTQSDPSHTINAAGGGNLKKMLLNEEEQRHSRPQRYKAFDYLDAREAQQVHSSSAHHASAAATLDARRADESVGNVNEASWRRENLKNDAQPGSTISSPLDWNPQQGKPHGSTADTVADIGHKAAKALQFGKKWIMQASKQLTENVQAVIEKRRNQSGNYPGNSSSSGNRSSHVAAYYYDWASQLSRMSPGSKVAALGAMDEDDRMAVQRIMDEADLGERVLAQTILNVDDGSGSARSRSSNNTAPPATVVSDGNGGAYGTRNAIRHEDRYHDNGDDDDDISYSTGHHVDHELSKHEEKRRKEATEPSPPPGYDDLMMEKEQSLDAQRKNVRNQEHHDQSTLPSASTAHGQPLQHARDIEDDLLGIHGSDNGNDYSKHAAASASMDVDLIGGDDGDHYEPQTRIASHATEHIDDMFTIRTSSTATAMDARVDLGGKNNKDRPTATNAISAAIALDVSTLDISEYKDLYSDKEHNAHDHEPEIRKILRQNRIAEKHERMMKQLAEKRDREEAEEAEKAGKVAFRESLKPKMEAWMAGKKDNIRALLSTLHVVLWDGSGWVQPSIADMVEASKVKKWYMKANLVVHPDKVKQKGGSVEQVATADMVFDVLKSAWGKFEEKELR